MQRPPAAEDWAEAGLGDGASLALAGIGAWRVNLGDGSVSWSRLTRDLHEVEEGYQPTLSAALGFYPPAAQAALRQALDRSAQDSAAWDLELPFVTARGRGLTVRVRGRAVHGTGGPPILYGIIEDITERAAQRAEHARFGLVVQQMTTPVIITDAAGRTEWVNEAFLHATGYSLADLHGRTPGSVLQGPDSDPRTVARMRAAIRAGAAFQVSLINRKKDGTPYWIEIQASPILGSDGTLGGFIAVESDITARRQAEEEALAELARRTAAEILLGEIIDTLPSAVYVCDRDDRIILWNKAYLAMFPSLAPALRAGTTIEGLIRAGVATGAYAEVVGPHTPEPERERWIMDLVRRIRSAGSESPGREIPLPGERWAQAREQRMPSGHLVSLRTDITALKRAMRAVEVAAEAKSMFLARMSHELRTPLNAILGFAQLLLSDSAQAPTQHEQLRLLHGAATHLRDLVNSLLDLAKINAGRLELEPTPVALGALLESCAGLLGPEAQRKDIVLRRDFAPDLPATVEADATRLRQMVLNLLANAVKFTPHGGRVTLRARPGTGDAIRIEVQDSGPGVPEDMRHRLFQDFTQLGRAGDPESLGTGLGLAITARLAALMQGRVGVESAPGQGAAFWLDLPLPRVSPPAPRGGVSREAPPLPPLRLLVADDIAANRTLLRAMLGTGSHEVTLVSDGAEALAQVAAGDFDAVLMDVRMPGMDGLEATRRIRALPPPRNRVPVIAVTASALAEEAEECRAAGMDAHIAKPLDRETLFAVLRRLRAAAPQAKPPPPGAALLAQVGPAGPAIVREFLRELVAVTQALDQPEAGQDPAALRALLDRGIEASSALGAEAARDAMAAAAAGLDLGGDAAAALGPLRQRLRAELPAWRLAIGAAPGATSSG
jgi:PAS domain S-box-containing protein